LLNLDINQSKSQSRTPIRFIVSEQYFPCLLLNALKCAGSGENKLWKMYAESTDLTKLLKAEQV